VLFEPEKVTKIRSVLVCFMLANRARTRNIPPPPPPAPDSDDEDEDDSEVGDEENAGISSYFILDQCFARRTVVCVLAF
jgi:hypothetical protein